MTMRRLGRPDCTDLGVAERREWLVANGRGSYAMGTVAGTLTRSYHGLLIAALEPPVARRLLVPTVQLEVQYRGTAYALATNRWSAGGRVPEGWRFLESFAVVDGVPTWTYALGDAELEVAVAMPYGLDRTALALRVVRAVEPVRWTARVLVADRDHHGGGLPEPDRFRVEVDGDRAAVALPNCGRVLHVAVPGAVLSPRRDRWSGFFLSRESERGLNPIDDYLYAVDARLTLAPGERGGLVVGLEPDGDAAPAIVDAARARGAALAAGESDALCAQLAVAADAFVVVAAPGGPSRSTIIAGYPWFSDWGRDTMIALPGLLIANGRGEVAEAIVRGFAPFVDGGMLPNVFPDAGSAPEYNTVDAALWYAEAIRACAAATRDPQFARDLFPVLRAIVAGYSDGTRYGIGVDPVDGLLRAGVAGVQLTWMDAKVGDWVITPRIGKPVEINALWFAALKTTAHFAEHCAADPQPLRMRRPASPMRSNVFGTTSAAAASMSSTDRTATIRPSVPINSLRSHSRPNYSRPNARGRSSTCACATCGPRSACARSPRAIRPTSGTTAATRSRATALTIKAPCGRGCSARSCKRISTSTTIRYWRARSSRRSPTRSTVTASERWARSSTATRRMRPAVRSRRPGASAN